jgi:hypothetical protein
LTSRSLPGFDFRVWTPWAVSVVNRM